MHRHPIVIANWKMYTSVAEASTLAARVRTIATQIDDVEIVLLPPIVWLPTLVGQVHPRPRALSFGVQNFYPKDEGAYTGEIGLPMIKRLAKYSLIGHSERRTIFNETDELINEKMLAALRHGVVPILCVGELARITLMKRGRGRPTLIESKSDIFRQLDNAFEGVVSRMIEQIVICYEPLWAIGTGKNVPGTHVDEILSQLRQMIEVRYGVAVASRVRTIYGGSVNDDTIQEYVSQPNIDGVLVGGASRNIQQFKAIIETMAERVHHAQQHIDH